jgi:hypothetical protein
MPSQSSETADGVSVVFLFKGNKKSPIDVSGDNGGSGEKFFYP